MKARTRNTTVRACAAALGLSGLVGTAGCGGDGEATADAAKAVPEATAAVRAAAGATGRAGSSRTKTSMTMQSGDRTVTMTGEGLFDYTRRIGTLVLSAPPGSGVSGPLEEILTAEALYMKNASPQVPKDKWVRVGTTTLADGNLVSGGGTDPGTSFEMLRGANDDVVLVGPENLQGVPVKHYKGTLDLKRARDLAPRELRPVLQAAVQSFATSTIPFEAYLDDQGRLRKVQEEFTLGAKGAGGKAAPERTARIVSTAELFDFGVPVEVLVPGPEEIFTTAPAQP